MVTMKKMLVLTMVLATSSAHCSRYVEIEAMVREHEAQKARTT